MSEEADDAQPIRTVAELLVDYGTLSEERLAAALGDAFLVGTGSRMLRFPTGPIETTKVPLNLVTAAARGDPVKYSPVFPMRRRSDSPYSFITLGRTTNCDIYVPDDSISKLHAIFRREGDEIYVQDAGSKNGTEVDDVPVVSRSTDRATLNDGARVRFGSVTTVFVRPAGLHALLRQVAAQDPTGDGTLVEEPGSSDDPSILIVDDSRTTRQILFDALTEAGFRVVTVASPFEAGLAAIRTKPALVLVDFLMPGMNGGQVCQSIKSSTNSKVWLMSALADSDLAALAEEYGADGFFDKATSSAEVVRRVQAALRSGAS